jgi:hypothetical protein
MNFAWHIDPQCKVNPECAAFPEVGRPVRYLGDPEWDESIGVLSGRKDPEVGTPIMGVRHSLNTGQVEKVGDLGTFQKTPRMSVRRIESREKVAERFGIDLTKPTELACLIALVLSVSFPLFAADEASWPQKGDTVYLAAALEAAPWAHMSGVKMPDYPAFEACAPATMRKRDRDDLFLIRDDGGRDRKLKGEWLPRLHRNQSDCRTDMEKNGQPRVKRAGYIYTLVVPETEPAADH